ncbi:FAD-dependent monooxygenase [Maritalea porphyrae]|jgi:2-octaprenyl-6-methoxyphenol hydroxylase|uniref:FAD-dependent monooxygenase n=3 Tax=Maritalea TaxID=623276 RepID=UPI0022B07AC3|nr:FAD-dependent monooxygenase [Maritalea porphyrae]MCZ4273113.1 FAD-dependent monooxygenase [Maritalea porphyrae]
MQYDIAIIGGGLTGVAAARLAAERGFSVVHFAPAFAKDYRTSALMMPTVDFMLHAGLISDPHAFGTPLRKIRIIDATSRLLRAPEALFDSAEIEIEAFGYNFANCDLLDAFSQPSQHFDVKETMVEQIKQENGHYKISSQDGTSVSATMLVGADGKKSKVRDSLGFASHTTPFKQSALVADVEFDRVEKETSVEFHYENGPFTLVPAGDNKINLVWLDDHEVLQKVANMPAADFAQELGKKSHHLFGHAKPLTKAFVFPLSNLAVPVVGKDGAFLIGEAAHAFPPIGAQGLNLGLRDVEDYVAAIDGLVPGFSATDARNASKKYDDLRQGDLKRTGGFVDGLFRSLITEMLPAQGVRLGGVWALKSLSPLRKFAFQFGMGR